MTPTSSSRIDLTDESGQSVIEYALLAILVAIVAFVLLSVIGVDVAEFFDSVEDVTGSNENGNEPVVVPSDDNASEAG
jgi:Flp pilus assembly pilin Flp